MRFVASYAEPPRGSRQSQTARDPGPASGPPACRAPSAPASARAPPAPAPAPAPAATIDDLDDKEDLFADDDDSDDGFI